MPSPRIRLTLRLALLMLCLAGVALWAASVTVRRERRHEWKRPLHVALITLGPGGVPESKSALIQSRLPDLNAFFAREFERYRGGAGFAPVEFESVANVGVEERPPMSPESDRFLDRALYAFEIARYTRDVNRRGQVRLSDFDARIYVMLLPARQRQARFVEGIGALNGDLGIVESELDPTMVDLTLVAAAHEFLHCVGATDKYDADGHSIVPAGLPEPDRVPLYPQRFAEVMVGERAEGPGAGALPNTLREVAIGPTTAAEIGWIAPAE